MWKCCSSFKWEVSMVLQMLATSSGSSASPRKLTGKSESTLLQFVPPPPNHWCSTPVSRSVVRKKRWELMHAHVLEWQSRACVKSSRFFLTTDLKTSATQPLQEAKGWDATHTDSCMWSVPAPSETDKEDMMLAVELSLEHTQLPCNWIMYLESFWSKLHSYCRRTNTAVKDPCRMLTAGCRVQCSTAMTLHAKIGQSSLHQAHSLLNIHLHGEQPQGQRSLWRWFSALPTPN